VATDSFTPPKEDVTSLDSGLTYPAWANAEQRVQLAQQLADDLTQPAACEAFPALVLGVEGGGVAEPVSLQLDEDEGTSRGGERGEGVADDVHGADGTAGMGEDDDGEGEEGGRR
jgi:hypothetical protein